MTYMVLNTCEKVVFCLVLPIHLFFDNPDFKFHTYLYIVDKSLN